jgi:hypothetical protein
MTENGQSFDFDVCQNKLILSESPTDFFWYLFRQRLHTIKRNISASAMTIHLSGVLILAVMSLKTSVLNVQNRDV